MVGWVLLASVTNSVAYMCYVCCVTRLNLFFSDSCVVVVGFTLVCLLDCLFGLLVWIDCWCLFVSLCDV